VATIAAITLDRSSAVPLYRQVEDQIRMAIHDERLRPGARLPGIRTLAADLNVARVTIATAYEQLTAEGYLVGRVGSGTTVAPDPPGRPPTSPATPAQARRTGSTRGPRFDLRPGALPMDGVPGGFPIGAWELRLRSAWRQASRGTTRGPAGSGDLRVALSTYLDAVRGTRTDPGRIVVGSGPRVLIAALVASVDGEGGSDRIPVLGLIEPIDPELRAVARRSGAATLDVPPQRAALHAAAGVVLVEDDRSSLPRLTGPPDPALQGNLAIGRLALIGGLDSLVVPGLSVGWMVVPGSLAESVSLQVEALDGRPSPMEQGALAGWISDGGLDRRMRRLRHALLERRIALEGALKEQLGELVTLEPPSPEPVVVARLALDGRLLAGLARAAWTVGVAILPPDDEGRLILGHAASSPEALVDAVVRLGRVIDALDPTVRRPPPKPTRPIRGPIVSGVFRRPGDGLDEPPVSRFRYAGPGPNRLELLGRALGGRRGPAATP
jgi:GntR family transcriptional regulator / MocR family aminotransferase